MVVSADSALAAKSEQKMRVFFIWSADILPVVRVELRKISSAMRNGIPPLFSVFRPMPKTKQPCRRNYRAVSWLEPDLRPERRFDLTDVHPVEIAVSKDCWTGGLRQRFRC
jgi:hypothetical protein